MTHLHRILDATVLRTMVTTFAEALMSAEADAMVARGMGRGVLSMAA
jgi:hypothetical protein